MKHLIETADLSSLGNAKYDRLILDSTTNEIVYRGGVKYEYVDLDLPSGLKWAKCNVGATSETDYGDYFMWGSTSPNTADECTWTNAPFNNGSSNYDETYFNSVKHTVCPNGILAKEYDAARAIMGSDWRMPTMDDFIELLDNTTNEWTQVNGVNGRKFTASNGNSIFIPAAGGCFNGSVVHVGNNGNVWSSSLNTSNPNNAWDLYFDSGHYSMLDGNRCYGRSVRGVRK